MNRQPPNKKKPHGQKSAPFMKGRRPHGRPRPQGRPGQNPQGVSGTKTELDKILDRYDNLLELHNQARKKYYELYYRADSNQHHKLENTFDRTLFDLRQYEQSLNPEQLLALRKARDLYDLDVTYTTNHELPVEGDKVPFQGKFEDPHTLQTQLQCDYSKDQEESVGTIDDYRRYKGL